MEVDEIARRLGVDLLPEEIASEIDRRQEARDAQLEAICRAVCVKRKAAVDARRSSGVEAEWRTSEDQYAGIDDANRAEQQSRERKGSSLDAPVTELPSGMPAKSTIYLNITRPYTDAAAARISDMLQQTDEPAWAFEPTPVPELEALKGDNTPLPGNYALHVPGPDGQPQVGPDGQPVTRPATYDDLAKAKMKVATDKAGRAEKRVADWLTQCGFAGTFRDLLLTTAKLGSAVLKGPVPVWRKSRKVTEDKGSVRLEMVSSIDPESKQVSPWNFYPDPVCGSDIQNGSYCLEKEDLTGRALRELKGLPGYSSRRIDKVLLEGPDRKFMDGNTERPDTGLESWCDQELFETWYFYGELDEQDFEMLAASDDLETLFATADLDEMQQGLQDSEKGVRRVKVVATMVNDTIIKVALNPLDSGAFPYDVLVWQARENSPWGYGVPYQIRAPQRIVVASVRNMMDNAGLSGGPILVVDQTMLEPVDGEWVISPRKVFRVLEGAIGKDVRTGLLSINIPNMQAEMIAIIQFGMKMAEDVTGLPMILQGQLGKAPDTVGGMQMLQNNASSVTRRLAHLVDTRVTTPHMTRYYEYLMLHGPEEAEKGDYLIKARGSSTLVQRDAQNQLIAGLVAQSLNPAFGLSPERSMAEFLRSQHLDPSRFALTDEEKKRMAEQPPPPPPQVMVAQIREQGAMQRTQIEAQVDMADIQARKDRDTEYVQAETARTQAEHEARMEELRLKLQLAQLDYAAKHQTTLEDVKAKLAMKAADINLTRELVQHKARADQLPKPPVEPPGRAPAGQSFAQ